MSPDEQDTLISRVEDVARRAPRGFVVRVAAMAFLAYAVLGTALLLLLGVGGGLVALVVLEPNAATIKLAIFFGLAALASAWTILRSFWVRLDPPVGLRVTEKDVPALFVELKGLCRALRVGRIHRVLMTPEVNASASEVPRFGLFGGTRRHLVLGLPLMQGLTHDQFRSVIAHELGHFSKEHNGITRWLYRVRITWMHLVTQAAEHGRGFPFFGPFLRWWWPRFNAHSFVLSRRQEYEADATAARAAGVQAAGAALMRLWIMSRAMDEVFWPGVNLAAVASDSPPGNLYDRLAVILRSDHNDAAERWLREALAIPTNNADTHPCLRDRLSGMGYPGADQPDRLAVPDPPSPEEAAAAAFLGPFEASLLVRFNGEWLAAVREAWKERHGEAAQRKAALDKIAESARAGELTSEERWERIAHVVDIDGDAAALPLLEEFLASEPDHAAANFLTGRILLDRDDPAGIDRLELAMGRDRFATPDACGLIHDYLQRKGRLEEAKGLERRVYDHELLIEEAQAEREKVNHRTPFTTHGLSGPEQEAIRTVFAEHPDVARADIVRAEVKILPENPYFLIAVSVKVPWWKFRGSGADQRLVNDLLEKLPVPGQFLIFTAKGSNVAALTKAVRSCPGSLVYERG